MLKPTPPTKFALITLSVALSVAVESLSGAVAGKILNAVPWSILVSQLIFAVAETFVAIVDYLAAFEIAPISRILSKTNIDGTPLIENSFVTQSMQVVRDPA